MINMVASSTIEETFIANKVYAKRALFEEICGKDDLSDPDPLEGKTFDDLIR